MIMPVAAVAEPEKMADATTQPQRLVPLKYVVLSSFNFKVLGCIAVAIVLISMASAKATNPCSETQHWLKDANGSTSCVDCEPCFPGQGLSIECGDHIPVSFSADIRCLSCPQGVSFSGNHDTSSCTPCSSCAEDQVVLRNCSSEWDIKCAKRCYSKDRYYNDDKGECLTCSKCCGDEQDVVEDECKQKLGAGSNMICSFDSSFNRCDKTTAHPRTVKHTTTANQGTGADGNNYTSPPPSQTSIGEDDALPSTTQRSHLSQRKDQDFWAAVGIPVVILVLLVVVGCVYFYKTRRVNTSVWCNGDAERGNPDSVTGVQYSLDKNALEDESQVKMVKMDRSYNFETKSPGSREPLLKQADPEILTCSCEADSKEGKDGDEEELANLDGREPVSPDESRESFLKEGTGGPGNLTCAGEMDTNKDSKLLSSLLEDESEMQKICECLDTPMPGVGHYRAVALYYGSNHYQIVSSFEKHWGGPSRAIIEWLAAKNTEITISEFATVVRKEAKRNDVVKLLEAYDLQQKS